MDRQYVGIDFHRRRSVIVRLSGDGARLGVHRIVNGPLELSDVIGQCGESPQVVIAATASRCRSSYGDSIPRIFRRVSSPKPEAERSRAHRSLRRNAGRLAERRTHLCESQPVIHTSRLHNLRGISMHRLRSWLVSALPARTEPTWCACSADTSTEVRDESSLRLGRRHGRSWSRRDCRRWLGPWRLNPSTPRATRWGRDRCRCRRPTSTATGRRTSWPPIRPSTGWPCC